MQAEIREVTTAHTNASLDIKATLLYAIMNMTDEERQELLAMWKERSVSQACRCI